MRYYILWLFLFIWQLSEAQVTVSGRITESQSDNPIPYAHIKSGSSRSFSDQKGEFRISVGQNDTILRISASFFQDVDIRIRGEQPLIIEMMPEEQNIEAITVTALRTESRLLNSTGPVSVITATRIARHSTVSLEPALNQVPGIYMHSGSLNTNRITIRGIGSRTPYGTSKIKAYLDDIPLTSGDGETTLEDISLLAISQVEIVRGPTSGVYGSGLGGAILLKTTPGSEAFRVQTHFMSGSYGTHKQGISVSANLEKSSHLLVTDFLYSDGYRENNRYNRSNLFSYNRFEITKKSQLSLLFDFVDLKAYIPSSVDYTTYLETPWKAAANWAGIRGNEDVRKIRGAAAFQSQLSDKTKITATAMLANSTNLELRPFNLLEEEALSGSGRLSMVYKTKKLEWISGTELFSELYDWATYKNKEVAESNLLSKNREHRFWTNMFSLAKWTPLPSLVIEPGLNLNITQYDYTDRFTIDGNASGRRKFPVLLSPRFGINWQTSANTALYGVASHGFSAPSLQETLMPDGQVNPDIVPETGWNFETGTRGKLFRNKLFYDISLYRMLVSNLLVARRTGEDAFVGVNAGKTTHTGLEYDLRYYGKLSGKIHWNAYTTGTWARYRFTDFTDLDNHFSGNALTGVPPVVLNSGVEFRTGKGWNTFLGYRHTGKLPMNDANTLYSDPYHLFNWKLGKNFQFLGLQWKAGGGINNLFDAKYASMILTNAPSFGTTPPRYYYPGLPRNYFITLQIGYIR